MKTEANDTINQAIGEGLTKREYFAAIAMQGILSGFPNYMPEEEEITPLAVKMADSLINYLNK